MDIRASVLSALSWSIGVKLVSQLINWGITLYVIRLLTPEDYGVMAIAMAFITIMLPLAEMGFGAAIVQSRTVDKHILQEVFAFVFLISIAALAILTLASGLLATLFEVPELSSLLPALSLGIPIVSLSVIPRALLLQEMAYRGQSLIDLFAGLLAGTTTLLLALHGYAVWSLVWGYLVLTTAQAIGLSALVRFAPIPRLRFTRIRDIAIFGSWLTAERLIWLLSTSIDSFVIAKLLGKNILGYFAIAKEIAMLPHTKVQGLLNNIAFPAYSRLVACNDDVTYYFFKYLRVSSLVAFPLYFGLAAIAPTLIPLLLTDKWSPSILPIQLIAMGMPLRAVEAAFAPYLHASGHVRIAFWNRCFALFVLLLALLTGSAWGLHGIAYGWFLSNIVTFTLVLVRSCRILKLSSRRILYAVGKCALPASIMLALVYSLQSLFIPILPPPVTVCLLIISGAAIYFGLSLLLCRDELYELLKIFAKRHELP